MRRLLFYLEILAIGLVERLGDVASSITDQWPRAKWEWVFIWNTRRRWQLKVVGFFFCTLICQLEKILILRVIKSINDWFLLLAECACVKIYGILLQNYYILLNPKDFLTFSIWHTAFLSATVLMLFFYIPCDDGLDESEISCVAWEVSPGYRGRGRGEESQLRHLQISLCFIYVKTTVTVKAKWGHASKAFGTMAHTLCASCRCFPFRWAHAHVLVTCLYFMLVHSYLTTLTASTTQKGP